MQKDQAEQIVTQKILNHYLHKTEFQIDEVYALKTLQNLDH